MTSIEGRSERGSGLTDKHSVEEEEEEEEEEEKRYSLR
jgi:hypothetical protein